MTTYALNESKMFMDIEDDVAIIINSETGIYYGFNAFGTSVLEVLSQGADTEAVLNNILSLPNAPVDLKDKFLTFVNELTENEILVEDSSQSVEIVLNATTALNDEFELSVQSYTDAQEMLLADPIHEVKEEMGWTPEKASIGYTKEETYEREKKMEK